jgi:hypothetical protein
LRLVSGAIQGFSGAFLSGIGEPMDDGEREKVLEQLTLIWGRAFQEKRSHDALAMAFANYLIARETRNEELEQSFLIAMRSVIEELLPPDESAKKDECSFCGSRPPDVRLATGPNVFICDGCVTMLSSEVFAKPT